MRSRISSIALPTCSTREKRWLALPLFLILLGACTMHSSTFDSDAWKSQRGVPLEDNKRTGMTEGLEEAIRIGMTRAEIIEVLGEPDGSREETSIDVYYLGRPTFGVDLDTYEFSYRDGRLVSFVRRQG